MQHYWTLLNTYAQYDALKGMGLIAPERQEDNLKAADINRVNTAH